MSRAQPRACGIFPQYVGCGKTRLARWLIYNFSANVFNQELNPDNPLGMGGAIAESFGALLGRIWNPTTNSYAPRDFKQVLARFAPQFSGYQQHDSQELVAFLLDGLHEDLNRVLKKPYVEKPDWEGGGDLELVRLAKGSWDGYMKRNDSVIVDLFQNQYRSTLICPECDKVSFYASHASGNFLISHRSRSRSILTCTLLFLFPCTRSGATRFTTSPPTR
jgi:ubiquitin C-terminal hydrolase